MLKLEKNITLTLAAVVKKKFTGKNDRLFYLKYHTYLALSDNSVFFQGHNHTQHNFVCILVA